MTVVTVVTVVTVGGGGGWEGGDGGDGYGGLGDGGGWGWGGVRGRGFVSMRTTSRSRGRDKNPSSIELGFLSLPLLAFRFFCSCRNRFRTAIFRNSSSRWRLDLSCMRKRVRTSMWRFGFEVAVRLEAAVRIRGGGGIRTRRGGWISHGVRE